MRATLQADVSAMLREGTFTPFLGAGASSPWPRWVNAETTPWREIQSALRKLHRKLPPSGGRREHLVSFVEQRFGISDDAARELLESPTQSRSSWPDAEISGLQHQLVELSACLGELFARTFASHHYCVPGNGDCTIRLGLADDGGASALARRFVAAIRAADRLRQASDEALAGPLAVVPALSRRTSLNAEAILLKLLRLSLDVLGNLVLTGAPFGEVRQRVGVQLARVTLPTHQTSDSVTLRVEHLAWLSNLLWYTLSFWSPCYPTTSELAFELALESEITPPGRVDLSQAAAAWDSPRRLTSHLRKRLAYCEEASSPSRLHIYLAAVLRQAYSTYRSSTASGSTSQHPGQEGASPLMPIAFTTNFDCALERALSAIGGRYHVIYPVRSAGGQSASVTWRYATYPLRDKETDRGDCKALSEDRLHGPVVVKLHGSPLHDLAKGQQHWIVAAGVGYLEAIAEAHALLPPWLKLQLKPSVPSRRFWFLGHSLNDWTIRLLLYEHLREARPGGAALMGILGTDDSLFRSLGTMEIGVEPYAGNLEEFPQLLHRGLIEIQVGGSLAEEVASVLAKAADGHQRFPITAEKVDEV